MNGGMDDAIIGSVKRGQQSQSYTIARNSALKTPGEM
jgi:hypothetical protein